MRRTPSVLVLASSAVVLAVCAYFSGIGLDRSPTVAQPTTGDVEQERTTVPGPQVLRRSGVPQVETSDDQGNAVLDDPEDSFELPPGAPPEVTRQRERQRLASELPAAYSLLFQHLALTQDDQDALIDAFLEVQMSSGTHTAVSDQERSQRIAAIIGVAKLEQFLELERNFASYAELSKLESLLGRNGVPLSAVQREGMFKILVDVRNRYEPLRSDAQEGSIEHIENILAGMTEYERLVVELAPSVLSSKQTVYLSEQYQYLSYQRGNDLEWQRKRRAEHPTDSVAIIER